MTITEAITQADAKHRNSIPEDTKVLWLSELDGRVYNDLISTHEGGEAVKQPEYTANTVRETELLIVHPYDKVYPLWIEAQTYFALGETERYLNTYSLFNAAYMEFARWYHRTHKPHGRKLKIF